MRPGLARHTYYTNYTYSYDCYRSYCSTACQNPYIHDHFFCSLLARYDDQYTSIPSTSDIFFGYQPASAAPSDGRALRVDTQALS